MRSRLRFCLPLARWWLRPWRAVGWALGAACGLACGGAVAAPAPAAGVASRPAEPDPWEQALASAHRQFDPAENLLRMPVFNPGYHTRLASGTLAHPIRQSQQYALDLLDTGKPEHLARAVAVLRRVLALQDTNPASRTYGIWSWYAEEPLAQMSAPDFNWADFNGVTLLQVLRDHRARLPADLGAATEAAVGHAMRCIRKRDVGPSYTNIALMGAYVTLVGGEMLHQPEFRAYGRARLQRFYDYTRDNGTFEEYNSPTYTIVALEELARLQAHVADPEALRLIQALQRTAWELVAWHFHPPTRQWAGPHSRAYSSLLRSNVLAVIERGTAGRVRFGEPESRSRVSPRLALVCPPEFDPFFRALPEPRTVTQTFVRRTGTVGTTYLHPHYALGTINHGDLWNQRRALLLHFGTAARPGYLQLRCLKNDYDFASALFHGAQREGLVLGAVSLVTDGGDTHVSLDKVKDAKIRARDLRLRFECGGPAAADARLTVAPGSATAHVRLPGLDLVLELAHARLGDAAGRWVVGGDSERRWLDVELYHGAEREFDLAALTEASVGFVFSVGPAAPVSARVVAGELQLAGAGLRLAAPVRPGAAPTWPAAAPHGLPAR